MDARIIGSELFLERLCAALGIDPGKTYRLQIDAMVGQPVRVHVEQYADDRIVDVELPRVELEAIDGQSAP